MDTRAPLATPAAITARLDRLPMTRHLWTLLTLVSLGGFFELYDLFFTGYIAPGLFRDKLITPTTTSFFGMTGLAGFLASLFLGLFVGTILFSYIADRFGRRTIFTFSLLWYSAATLILAFQDTSTGLNVWRFIGGIGIGIEMVTIDTYISELTPKNARGKAFGLLYGVAQVCAPVIAFLAWLLVPIAPLGFAGWRWIILAGSLGAIAIWWLRLGLPESPRWLAQQGRLDEAERVIGAIEAKVLAESGRPLPAIGPLVAEDSRPGRFLEMFDQTYRSRTFMLMAANFFQTIGYYGFVSWIPTLLIAKGIHVTSSLEYTFLIVLVYPLAPFAVMTIADKFERKWQLVLSAICVAILGIVFASLRTPVWLIIAGAMQTLAVNWMSTMIHAYQAELFPTRIRARAVGFVFSWSRLSSVFTGFLIAFFLRDFGVPGVFLVIGGAMAALVIAVGAFGPLTTRLTLEEIAR